MQMKGVWEKGEHRRHNVMPRWSIPVSLMMWYDSCYSSHVYGFHPESPPSPKPLKKIGLTIIGFFFVKILGNCLQQVGDGGPTWLWFLGEISRGNRLPKWGSRFEWTNDMVWGEGSSEWRKKLEIHVVHWEMENLGLSLRLGEEYKNLKIFRGRIRSKWGTLEGFSQAGAELLKNLPVWQIMQVLLCIYTWSLDKLKCTQLTHFMLLVYALDWGERRKTTSSILWDGTLLCCGGSSALCKRSVYTAVGPLTHSWRGSLGQECRPIFILYNNNVKRAWDILCVHFTGICRISSWSWWWWWSCWSYSVSLLLLFC